MEESRILPGQITPTAVSRQFKPSRIEHQLISQAFELIYAVPNRTGDANTAIARSIGTTHLEAERTDSADTGRRRAA